MRTRWWTALAGLAGGCGSAVVDDFATCRLELELAATSGAPGEIVAVAGGPFTEVRDTVVHVGGVVAEVAEVTRTDCDRCDECRASAGCAPCGRCLGEDLEPAARKACFGDPFAGTPGDCAACEQTLAFVVPSGVVGPTEVWVVNRNGTSEPAPFEVVAVGPATTGDTGP